jgi:CHAT domain-containing protein
MRRFGILALFLLAIGCSLPDLGLGEEAENLVPLLEARVDSLQIDGKYSEALEVARELLSIREGDDSIEAYRMANLKMLVGTLDYIASLPPEAQLELTEANRLSTAVMESNRKGEHKQAFAAAEKQLDVYRRLLGRGHLYVARSLRRAGAAAFNMREYSTAEPLFREALTITREAFGDEHPAVAGALYSLGTLLSARSDYSGAESLHREALAINRKLFGSRHSQVARNLYALAGALHAKGDYAEVEGLYREALAIWREALGNEHRYVADCLENLAFHLHYAKGDHAEAETACREALAINRTLFGDEHPRVAGSLTTLGEIVAFGKGDYAEAESLCREAVLIVQKTYGDEHYQMAWCMQVLGNILKIKADYANAEPMLRRALAIRRKVLGSGDDEVAWSLYRLGDVLYGQGDYAGAEPLYREALSIFRRQLGGEHQDVASLLVSFGGLLVAKGDYAGAEAFYREALAIERKLLVRGHRDITRTLVSLANLLYRKGEYDEAESLYLEVLTVERELKGKENPYSLTNLARLLHAKSDYASAKPLYLEADIILRETYGGEHPYVLWNLRHLARLLCEEQDYAGAESLLVEAADAYDVARLRAGAGTERATFAYSPYPRLAAVRLTLGDSSGAWVAAERDLGRVLADLLMTAGQRPLSSREQARADSLMDALGILQEQVLAFHEAAQRDSTVKRQTQFETARTRLFRAEAEWSAFQREIAAKYPVREGEAYSLERVQAALDEDMAILGWLNVTLTKGTHGPWAYLIRNSGPVVWASLERPHTQGGLSTSERVRQLSDGLASPEISHVGVKHDAGALWGVTVAPLADALKGIERIIVIPSGAMLGVPVEALVDNEGAFLGDRFSISYAPSATIHAWLNELPPTGEGRQKEQTLLVGDPPFTNAHLAAMEGQKPEFLVAGASIPDGTIMRGVLAGNEEAIESLPRLPGTGDEVRRVSLIAREPTLLLGPDASEQELTRLAEAESLIRFSTIHIATHALVDDESPERSALVLSQVNLPDALEAAVTGVRVFDGLVTAREIVSEWKLDADLVTLSACETGLGREVRGEGYVGFSHAFFQAGARSLLVSLWKVEDRATSLLMERFYENYFGRRENERAGNGKERLSKVGALREAKQWLRDYVDEEGHRPYEHPYYWSAFILIGDRGRDE